MQIFLHTYLDPKALAVPIVAMANADGGVLAIGVSDKTRRIEGIDGKEERLNELLRVPFDFCNPSVRVKCEYLQCTDNKGHDNRILLMHIPASGQLHTDNIRHTHFSRNPKIAQYLKAYKYVKEFGEGMDRIYRELNVNHTNAPKVHLDAFILKISVYKNTCKLIENASDVIENNEKVTKKVSDVIENASDVIEKVTESHKKVTENQVRVIEKVTEKANNLGDKLTENKLQILLLMLANPYITKQEMAKTVGISVKSISANIAAMRGKYLNRVGPDKGGFWEVIFE